MKRLLIAVATAILLAIPSAATADEGMWLVNLIQKGLVQKMNKAGLKLPANVIYDESAVSLSDAVVSLDFGCTGSMISNQGLLITNHHCAYSDVHSISTPEHNYLEDGFWAMNMAEEVPIPGKGVYFLRKAIDVTEEVASIRAKEEAAGHVAGFRRLSSIIEKKYTKESGYEASLSSMWDGEKYYIFLYEVFRDIRLVAAPPVSIAAFGGDTDNWEWPQHKGDFSLYRIYASPDGKPAEYSKDNVPFQPRNILKVSTKGVKKGDFTMIMGYPGRTNRYNSSFGVNYIEKVSNPITTTIRRHQLDIMDSWMIADPAVRLKYADKYFSLSNVQELNEGEILTFRRYGVASIRQKEEKELQQWIDADPDRKAKWGTLLEEMKELYASLENLNKQTIYYRETLVRGTQMFSLSMRVAMLIRDSQPKKGKGVRGGRKGNQNDSITVSAASNDYFLRSTSKIYNESDIRVEKDLFSYAFRTFITNMEKKYWGENITSLMERFNGDASALINYVWENSFMTSKEKFDEFTSTEHLSCEYESDPMYKVINSISIGELNKYKAQIEKEHNEKTVNSLEKQYTNAIYQMRNDKGEVQYPDANSTMRLTYGNVGPINPSDGIYYSETSTSQGILDKYNPDDYEFTLKERSKELLEAKDWGRWGDKSGRLDVNFLSNNDITGGNSGSPVMNARGELVGLAFDGNKESLCGDAYFHPDYCKCVNVDIRYVLWILDKYADMQWILTEIGINK